MGLFGGDGGGWWLHIERVERKVKPPRQLPLWAFIVGTAVVGSLLMIGACCLFGRGL